MKTRRAVAAGSLILLLAAGCFFSLTARAQTLSGISAKAIAVADDATALMAEDVSGLSDFEVQLKAVESTKPIAAETLPEGGNYFSVQHINEWPPLPGNILGLDVWPLDTNTFLLDDREVDYPALTVKAAPVKGKGSAMLLSLPGPGDGDGGTNSGGGGGVGYSLVIDTNGLWLEITNVANGLAYVNLHSGTNFDFVYEIYSKTNLLASVWKIETEVWPDTNYTVAPFTVPVLDRTNLFIWARDWTGIDGNTNGLPDWWEWKYFGNFNQTATNDYDGDGVNNGQEYTNATDPNTIGFATAVTNNHVGTSTAAVGLNIWGGVPANLAVLVDSTNFSSASWQPYTATAPVNLGPTQGWHEVWIGLKGLPGDAEQTWQWRRLKLDTTPPALVITGPTNSTGAMPLIQLTGYSPEALAGISYDLTNASGMFTNQPVLITDQVYSTNTWEFMTNRFQGFDVRLTNGVNTFTLHATDLAGNVTTLTTNFTLNAANLPTVGLIWPQAGMQLSGSNFTIEGRVDDASAVVSAVISDNSGNTNHGTGLTGRDGIFWLEQVPLQAGTNHLTLTAHNAAGDTTTNIDLIQSSLALTVNAVAAGDPTVSGSVGTNGYTIWVNGVQASQSSGTWTAQITPLCAGGGLVTVTAQTTNQTVCTQATVQPPEGVFLNNYQARYNLDSTWEVPLYESNDWSSVAWQDGCGGVANKGVDYMLLDQFIWPTNHWPESVPLTTWLDLTGDPATWIVHSNWTSALPLTQEHCDITWVATQQTGWRKADAEMKLATGGPLGSTEQNLWVISATATAYTNELDTTGVPVPPEQITIGSFGNLDTNGNLYVLLPDNDPDDVTPHPNGKDNHTFTVGATKYHLYIKANGVNLDYNTPMNCVGQQMTFSVGWVPSTPDNIAEVTAIWKLPGTFVNTNSDPNCDLYYSEDSSQLNRIQSRDGTTATSCWYVKALQTGPVQLAINVTMKNGRQFILQTSGQFNVTRPTATFISSSSIDGTPTVVVTNGYLSLGWNRYQDMSFGHQINPGDFAGQAGYVQLVSGEYTAAFGNLVDIGGGTPDTELDGKYGEFPRGQPSIPANTNSAVAFWDGPANALFNSSSASMNVRFSTYLMFKPDGGIWVPLRLVTWTLDDEAANGSLVNGGQHVTGPSDNDCSTFPDWKNTFSVF